MEIREGDAPESDVTFADDLLLDLAQELSVKGYPTLVEAIDAGSDLWLALERLLHQARVLVVIDEFQFALVERSETPRPELLRLLQHLGRRAQAGRLLLVSNRAVERDRWTEAHALCYLDALTQEEAIDLLLARLNHVGKPQAVPPERHPEIVRALGYNPRAIGVLAETLRYEDSLDELIGEEPDLWSFEDRRIDVDLLARLERRLLEHTLSRLEPDPMTVLERYCVYRKAVKARAFKQVSAGIVDVAGARALLVDRFLIEHDRSWDRLNPLVREIILHRLDEAEMLHLWSSARNGMNAPVEGNFPGLAEYRRRNASQTQPAKKSPMAQSSKQTCVLAVATEWDSRHGGLSTFNRDLCAALAGAGVHIVCYVPLASADEKDRASAVGVTLVDAPVTPGAKDVALLLQRPRLSDGFVPDVVIGHDRVTGSASVTLARDHYSGSKRVLFIHTSPEEIEWHKEPRDDSTSAGRAAERKKEQLDLAKGCDLVVAVGPHLAAEFGTYLHGAGNPVPLLQVTPGLPEGPEDPAPVLPPAIRCLILGRVEDYQLKGLDLAAKALGRVVANWKQSNLPKLVVRGAPVGTDPELRKRLAEDSTPTELDVVVRHYSADETEIRTDLREASLVLMPSKKEGFGLVGLEAIACGVPTLISAQSGLAETVRLHAPLLAEEWILPVTGNVVPKWAERIEFLLMGRNGAFARAAALRERLAVELDWRSAATALLDMLFPREASSATHTFRKLPPL